MRIHLVMAALLLLLTSSSAWAQTDTDGDGLPDAWETNGVNVTVDGKPVFVDLPAMGADPQHKDLFVEIDYMTADGHSHQPKPEALRMVIDSFAAAPVSNPDGKTGINIHLDAGKDSVMDPVKGTTWGDRTGSNALDHQDNLGSGTRNSGYVWTDFLALKAKNFKPERAGIFRYCIFAHNLGTSMGATSGWARGIPGTDLVVSLGGWTGQTGTAIQQAGTFMHELGHALGLRHGGDVNTHRKPNYLSVMNYAFQTRGLRIGGKDGRLDYSRVKLPDLDETALNETVGLNSTDIPNFGTRWRVDGNEASTDNATAPVDWNQDGAINATAIQQDVNDDGDTTTLGGFNDWPALVYGVGGVLRTDSGDDQTFEEIDQSQDDQIKDDFEPAVDLDEAHRTGIPGQAVAYNLTVTNLGTRPDVFQLTTNSSLGWSDFSNLPAQVSLNPGQSMTYGLQVLVPLNATTGQSETSTVEARSQGNPAFVDEDLAVTEASAPGSGFSGSAGDAGGSGCFIATAAYGSYLDPHVVSLRHFRDRCLLTNPPGRAAVACYYRWSPPLAVKVARSPLLRGVTLVALTPVVAVVEHPLAALVLALAGVGWLRRRSRSTSASTIPDV